jgi:hypothetical protein
LRKGNRQAMRSSFTWSQGSSGVIRREEQRGWSIVVADAGSGKAPAGGADVAEAKAERRLAQEAAIPARWLCSHLAFWNSRASIVDGGESPARRGPGANGRRARNRARAERGGG